MVAVLGPHLRKPAVWLFWRTSASNCFMRFVRRWTISVQSDQTRIICGRRIRILEIEYVLLIRYREREAVEFRIEFGDLEAVAAERAEVWRDVDPVVLASNGVDLASYDRL